MTLFSDNQKSLPSMEHKDGTWRSVAFVSYLYGISEQAVRNWIDDGIIERPTNNLLNLEQVIRKIYKHQRDMIARIGDKSLTSERTKMMRTKREINELELEIKRGKLLDAEKIKRVAFSRAKMEAEMLNSLPSRLKSVLAAENDEFKVGQILQQEIEHIANTTIEICQEQFND